MWSGSLFNHYKPKSTSVQWHHKSELPTHTRHAEFRTKNVSAIGQSLLACESPLSQAIRTSPPELSLAPRWLVQMTLDTLLRCAPGPWVNQLQTELIIFPPEKKKCPRGWDFPHYLISLKERCSQQCSLSAKTLISLWLFLLPLSPIPHYVLLMFLWSWPILYPVLWGIIIQNLESFNDIPVSNEAPASPPDVCGVSH